MTEVIVLHRIPGARAGAILPLDERMKNHVAAGNAAILPNEHDAWADEPVVDAPTPVLVGASTGVYSGPVADDEADEDTED